MVSGDLIKEGNFDKIRELTEDALHSMLGFELAHIGINCEGESEADEVADAFGKMFGFGKKTGNSSIFAGSFIEAMKSPYLGKNGHIAIKTRYIDRAVYYLESQGFELDMDTAKYKNDKLTAVYLKAQVGGFAIHLVQK